MLRVACTGLRRQTAGYGGDEGFDGMLVPVRFF